MNTGYCLSVFLANQLVQDAALAQLGGQVRDQRRDAREVRGRQAGQPGLLVRAHAVERGIRCDRDEKKLSAAVGSLNILIKDHWAVICAKQLVEKIGPFALATLAT
jgi:hypothetical protein